MPANCPPVCNRLSAADRPCGTGSAPYECPKHSKPELPNYVAGHSLGGALAQLAAHDIQTEFKQQYPQLWVSCYTLGGPRVGNRAFADTFHKSGGACQSDGLHITDFTPLTYAASWPSSISLDVAAK